MVQRVYLEAIGFEHAVTELLSHRCRVVGMQVSVMVVEGPLRRVGLYCDPCRRPVADSGWEQGN